MLGIHVSLAHGRKCCGRPAFSQGNLDLAAKFGEHNINLLSSLQNASSARASPTPIIFLEPSCYSMFVEDYRELKIPGAESIAQRSFLFEKFVNDILEREPEKAARFQKRKEFIAIHAHCHAKSILDPAFMVRLVEKLPGRKAKLLETGCCGMAGGIGVVEGKRGISREGGGAVVGKIMAGGGGGNNGGSGKRLRSPVSGIS